MTGATPLDQYRPYDSIDGDRRQLAAGLASMIGAVLTDGVMPNPGNTFAVTAASGWSINIAPGKCIIAGGRMGQNDATKTMTLDPSDGVRDRIDSIMIRHDPAKRQICLQISKGTASASPVAVEPQRNADGWEMCIAQIRVGRTATSITQSAITDTRQNAALCGIVNSLIQADATTLFSQYQAIWTEFYLARQAEISAWQTSSTESFTTWQNQQKTAYTTWSSEQQQIFNLWFNGLQASLSGDVAANLAALIAAAVPNTRTVNGKALNANIALAAADVSAPGLTNGLTNPAQTTQPFVAVTASRAITAADIGKTLYVNSANAVTLTLPASGLQSGFEFNVWRAGNGDVMIKAPSGVTMNGVAAGTASIPNRYEALGFKQYSNTVWCAIGAPEVV